MQFLKELSRSSRDSLESESDSKESWDDWLNSPKSGIVHVCHLLANSSNRPGICSNRNPIRANPGTICLIRLKIVFVSVGVCIELIDIIERIEHGIYRSNRSKAALIISRQKEFDAHRHVLALAVST